MNNIPINCPICQSPIRHIPAGISKRTNKPYDEFWACSNRDCKYIYNPERQPKPAAQKEPQPKSDTQLILDKLEEIRKAIEKSVVIYPDNPPQSDDGYKNREQVN